jgi:hypothetical protein
MRFRLAQYDIRDRYAPFLDLPLGIRRSSDTFAGVLFCGSLAALHRPDICGYTMRPVHLSA